jgi:hypothetical protein
MFVFIFVNVHCDIKEKGFYKGFYNLNMISLAIQEVFSHLAGEIYCTMSVFLFLFYYSYWLGILFVLSCSLDQSLGVPIH